MPVPPDDRTPPDAASRRGEQPPAPVSPAPGREAQDRSHEAQAHYRRGNRFFDAQAWDSALEEWRLAAALWRGAQSTGRRVVRRLLNLRAALALLATVALVYMAVFTLFPRDPFEMFMLGGGGGLDQRSWWERFLDSGRPRSGDGHKMGIREWWNRFTRDQRNGGQRGTAHRWGRPGIEERWEQLLRRYGRWGPFFNSELSYDVIAGYGLTRMGDYARAVEVFERAIRRAERPEKLADLYQGLANAHYYSGYHLHPNGLATYDLTAVRKATEAYENSVRNQARPVSYGNLGWMYFLLGQYDKAETYSRRALDIDGNLEYVRLNLGLTLLMEGRVYDSFRTYREVIRREPGDDVYLGGINDLREVIRDHPTGTPFAHLMVGMLALKRLDYELAREHLSRFAASPTIGRSWRDLARGLLKEMRIAEMHR